MKKTFYRDYATAAFRLWSAEGCPTVDSLRTKKWRKTDKAKREDLLACAVCMEQMQEMGKEFICAAVRAVYMAEPGRELTRGDITGRVIKFALACPASERQVYNWLYTACVEFANARGLRVE